MSLVGAGFVVGIRMVSEWLPAQEVGAELTAISILPNFLEETFGLSIVQAGMVAASYSFLNLVARPDGGIRPVGQSSNCDDVDYVRRGVQLFVTSRR